MNCKRGDLAIVIGSSAYAGMIVHVLQFAPRCNHDLPDGYPAIPADVDSWIVRLQRPVKVPIGLYGECSRMALYGVMADRALRPVSGIPESDSATLDEPIAEVA